MSAVVQKQRDDIIRALYSLYDNPILQEFSRRLNSISDNSTTSQKKKVELQPNNYYVEFEKILEKYSGYNTKGVMQIFQDNSMFRDFLLLCSSNKMSIKDFRKHVKQERFIRDFLLFLEERYIVLEHDSSIKMLEALILSFSTELRNGISNTEK